MAFQNLRSSSETDWLERFPGRLKCAARRRRTDGGQSGAQSGAATGGNGWKLPATRFRGTAFFPGDVGIPRGSIQRGTPRSRGDPRLAMYNRGLFDIATLAIFPEYIEFDGEEVLRLVVPGAAGRTIK